MSQEVQVPEHLAGERLDKALVSLISGASRAKVKRALELGQVKLNGRRAAKGAQLAAGDVLHIEGDALSSAAECVPDADAPLDVRFASDALLVVHKPAKMPTAPLRPGETSTLANALLGHHPELAGVGYGAREPGLLHRLDNDTSGLLVVARSQAVFTALRQAMEAGEVEKDYLLLCRPSEQLLDHGSVSIPLANHPKDQKRVLACVHPRDVMRNAPRPAQTDYEKIQQNGDVVLVRARASMALRHQIRAHFAALGAPLLGDTLYGGESCDGLSRHALHAERVAYHGARSELHFDVRAALPEDLQRVLDRG